MRRRLIGLVAVALGLAAAGTAVAHQPAPQKLVVRGEDNVGELRCDASGVCDVAIAGGRFRGTPQVGSGSYEGALKLYLRDAFPNGEGGLCAPLRGTLVLANRLTLAVDGNSCQDGGGKPTEASFTGLSRVRSPDGSVRGLATFVEDADDHERMTLIGTTR